MVIETSALTHTPSNTSSHICRRTTASYESSMKIERPTSIDCCIQRELDLSRSTCFSAFIWVNGWACGQERVQVKGSIGDFARLTFERKLVNPCERWFFLGFPVYSPYLSAVRNQIFRIIKRMKKELKDTPDSISAKEIFWWIGLLGDLFSFCNRYCKEWKGMWRKGHTCFFSSRRHRVCSDAAFSLSFRELQKGNPVGNGGDLFPKKD